MLSAQELRKLTPAKRKKVLSRLTEQEAAYLNFHWPFWARSNQLAPPGDWAVWLMLAGRGFGKTRSAAEWARHIVDSGKGKRGALVGQTASAVRDVIIEGESGLMSVFPPWQRPQYEPSKRRITFHNGTIATTYSADAPELLRGPQHDWAWCDELAAWKRAKAAWDNLMLGLRLGTNPQVCVSTTPKPLKLLMELARSDRTVITKGTTYDNLENLAQNFKEQVLGRYEGTTLGRQELYAELLDELPGAAWKRSTIDAGRIDKEPTLDRKIVSVDPATTSNDDSDETGIVVAGKADRRGYLLADLSMRAAPLAWAKRVVSAYYEWDANEIIAESNQGGDMVKTTIHTVNPDVPVRLIHASKGKSARAEPVSAKYEQGLVHHVGIFGELEDQMCNWQPGEKSPDRLDAMVHAFTDLLLKNVVPVVSPSGSGRASPFKI